MSQHDAHRQQAIRKSILETLSHTGGYALPEVSLREHVDSLQRPPVQDAEWEDAMGFLQRRQAVRNVPNALDDSIAQWAITEAGRVILIG